jgi:iron complex outermembrane recepter protein
MLKKSPLASAISLAIASGTLAFSGEISAQDDGLEEIVATGTRIRSDVYTSSTPMDVITADVGALRGVADIATLLQTATVAAGSPQVTAASSTAFVEDGGAGVRTLSLRGLGPNRTLVLLNNRRAGPAGVRGAVSAFDFNVLPLTAVDRVEILKDGASSIYGSDAVAGVVNIFTKREDGGAIDGYTSQPSRSGGDESRLSVSWGQSFSRGRFQMTGDFHRESELRKRDRDYFRCGEQYIFDEATGARADVVDPRTGEYWCSDLLWGHVWIYDYQEEGGNVPRGAKAQYDYDGDLGNYIPPIDADPNDPDQLSAPPGWYLVNYDRATDGVSNANHPFNGAASLIPKLERSTLFADGELDIGDRVQGYAEVLLNRRKTSINDYRQYWSYIYSANYGFDEDFDLVPGGGNPLSSGWMGRQWLSPTPITNHSGQTVEVDYQRYVLGAGGDLGSDWFWDVSVQYSRSDGKYHNDQIFDDAIWAQNFLDGSCEGMLTDVRGVPCIDVPWLDPDFLRGDVSPQVREFLFGRETGNTKYEQRSIEGFVSGRLATLPAGPLGGAFGVQYTEDEIRDVPGEITLAGNAWGSSSAGITAGDDTTRAVFAELQIPLLTGKPGVEHLSLNASGRYTDVDSYGSDNTYKVGLNWEITPSVRLRANQGTSFRSPALFELYLADQTSFQQQRFIDPCINWGDSLEDGSISQRLADNCAADGVAPDHSGAGISATIVTGGGLGTLEAERSKSSTVGVVWQPGFSDFSVSLDYFDIEVKNEVTRLGAGQVIRGCYNSQFFPDEPLCDLFSRDGFGGNIDTVDDSYINIATQNNRGYDLSLRWQGALGWGALTVETQHTYQSADKLALFEDTMLDENGEFGHPKWVGRLSVTADMGSWSYFWGARMIGSVSNHGSFGGHTSTYRGDPVRVVLDADSVVYHAFSAARMFDGGDLTLRFGVANAFNEKPPRVTTLNLGEVVTMGDSAFYSQYDWVGRRFYMNLTKRF